MRNQVNIEFKIKGIHSESMRWPDIPVNETISREVSNSGEMIRAGKEWAAKIAERINGVIEIRFNEQGSPQGHYYTPAMLVTRADVGPEYIVGKVWHPRDGGFVAVAAYRIGDAMNGWFYECLVIGSRDHFRKEIEAVDEYSRVSHEVYDALITVYGRG